MLFSCFAVLVPPNLLKVGARYCGAWGLVLQCVCLAAPRALTCCSLCCICPQGHAWERSPAATLPGGPGQNRGAVHKWISKLAAMYEGLRHLMMPGATPRTGPTLLGSPMPHLRFPCCCCVPAGQGCRCRLPAHGLRVRTQAHAHAHAIKSSPCPAGTTCQS